MIWAHLQAFAVPCNMARLFAKSMGIAWNNPITIRGAQPIPLLGTKHSHSWILENGIWCLRQLDIKIEIAMEIINCSQIGKLYKMLQLPTCVIIEIAFR